MPILQPIGALQLGREGLKELTEAGRAEGETPPQALN